MIDRLCTRLERISHDLNWGYIKYWNKCHLVNVWNDANFGRVHIIQPRLTYSGILLQQQGAGPASSADLAQSYTTLLLAR